MKTELSDALLLELIFPSRKRDLLLTTATMEMSPKRWIYCSLQPSLKWASQSMTFNSLAKDQRLEVSSKE